MAIDKIKQLLAASGVSDKLATQIVESMVEYKAAVVAESNATIAQKIKLAKQVVLEEVDLYKQELARKVQIFCESKSQAIDQQLKRKSAASETEASTKLTKVYALLEGIELDGKPNSKLEAQIADASNRLSSLTKQLSAAKTQAKRATSIAESVMAKNKSLITENQTLKSGGLIKESRVEKKTAEKSVVIPARTKSVTQHQINESSDKIATKTKSSGNSNKTIVDPIAAIAGLMK